jgi:transglutaminase-like putative cysteine protease
MNLNSVFLFSIYSMIGLAAAMLAYGEETPFPSAITVLLAGVALFFNERERRLRLSVLASNLLGLTALGVALVEFSGSQEDAKLLAGAHFLVYITWIVLFQKKEIRHYWWLCALSLLQVAVGPLFTMSTGWYGVMLLAYLVLAIWTLSVFTLYQGAVEFGESPGDRDGEIDPTPPPEVAAPRSADPLGAFRQAFTRGRPSVVASSIQQDSPGRWIGPRFVAGVFGLAVVGLSLGLVLFLFVPRVKLGPAAANQSDSKSDGPAATGYASEIRLGQLGQILESTDRVMEVGLFDSSTDQPLSLDQFATQQGYSAPMFRGNVLEVYGKGRWYTGHRTTTPGTMGVPRPSVKGLVRQEYTLELRGSDVLFAMAPFELARLGLNQTVSVDPETNVLSAPVEGRDQVAYAIYSKGSQTEYPAGDAAFPPLRRLRTQPRTLERCRQLPDGLARLTVLAQELTAREKLTRGERQSHDRQMALTLETYLRDSGQYGYSLNMAVHDPNIDPVEDFLFNRRRGHCEYFASSLALMLRAVQVPSRLVTGFKGAETLGGAGYYEVEQRHAHAWVEAFVDGQWITLDPTPGERDDNVREVAARAGFWKNARSSISSLWSTYVVSLSLNRQQQTLYDPLQGSVSSGWGSVRGVLQRVASAVAWVKDALSSPEQMLTPRGAVTGLLLIVVAFAAVKFVRQAAGQWQASVSRLSWRKSFARCFTWLFEKLSGRSPDPAQVVVAFYAQFQALVAALGLLPRHDQTQREFAAEVEAALAERLSRAGLAHFPSELSELFYRVRFGAAELQPAETIEVEHRLQRLKESLASTSRRLLPSKRLASADIDS